jgi:predicted MFS family arabinose efflux permease
VAEHRPLDRATVVLLSVATGVSVANLYYCQPLLADIRQDLHLGAGQAGLLVTVTQFGYALALLLAVPLGDLLERRTLLTVMCVAEAAALAAFGATGSTAVLYVLGVAIGVFSTAAQLLVAFAATLAAPGERGRVVGTVMSGLLLGILLARTAAGYLAQLGGWRTVYLTAAALMLALTVALRARLPRARPGSGGYGALLRSVFTLLREEPVLRLRSAYGALAFAAFSVLWTPLALMLAGAPHHFSSGLIGLFGLAGAAGAAAAPLAGRIADRGGARLTTGLCALTLTVSWLPIGLGRRSVTLLVVGIVLFDLAVQGLHITNQSEIYKLRPEARSRITAAYMTLYFIGGVTGSALASAAWTRDGWRGVSLLGAAFGGCLIVLWLAAARVGRRRATGRE